MFSQFKNIPFLHQVLVLLDIQSEELSEELEGLFVPLQGNT